MGYLRDASIKQVCRKFGEVFIHLLLIFLEESGEKVGIEAFSFAEEYFNGNSPFRFETIAPNVTIAPNPVASGELLDLNLSRGMNDTKVELMKTDGSRINHQDFKVNGNRLSLNIAGLNSGLYVLRLIGNTWSKSVRIIIH